MTDNMIAKIREHYEHAKQKHPYFCDLINPEGVSQEQIVEEADNVLSASRSALESKIDKGEVHWLNVLMCEIAEAAAALARNDTAHAVEECYDAIAVLLRVVDVLEGRQPLGKPKGGGCEIMILVDLDIVPPTVTAQQKGVYVRNGRAHFFTKQKVRDAENFLAAILSPHAPEEPVHEPVFLQVRWCFPYRKSEKKSITRAGLEVPHTSRPDLDNLEKALLDVLTRCRFWDDDSQVFSKSTAKFWGPSPYLKIAIKTEAELYNMKGSGAK